MTRIMYMAVSSSILKRYCLPRLSRKYSKWPYQISSGAQSRITRFQLIYSGSDCCSVTRARSIVSLGRYQNSSMTTRATFCSLRPSKCRRMGLFSGRQWRLLDDIAQHGRNPTPKRRREASPVLASSNDKRLEQTNKPAANRLHFSKSIEETDTEYSAEISCEGRPLGNDIHQITALASKLQDDAIVVVQALIRLHQMRDRLYLNKELVELSLVLTDDAYIHSLNLKYLNDDRPTDVLSFPMDGEEDDHLPIMLLGDIVISLDTAARQAKQMGHDLLTECRILLVHGLLHLLGYDHDRSDRDWAEMAGLEKQILAALGWNGVGLIANAQRIMLSSDIEAMQPCLSSSDDEQITVDTSAFKESAKSQTNDTVSVSVGRSKDEEKIQLVAVDMDGTLLTSKQRIDDSSKSAIEEALGCGIKVVVATGKARPGAIAVCKQFGLYGEGSLISQRSAGIFLQGLVVHTATGEAIAGPSLSPEVVRSAFDYAALNGVSCVCFKGDDAYTLHRTSEVIELHERYFEPLAEELSSIDEILKGDPVKKVLFMTDPLSISEEIRPYWDSKLNGTGSQSVLAVPSMLELIPEGVNKWAGLRTLLDSMHLSYRSCMAIGDGSNDYDMIRNVAIGVAMGNAVDEVKSVANFVVSSNDDGGIAEAFEKFVLS